jgi:hypothetical protein
MSENGRVVQTIFTPGSHSTSTGFITNGDLVILNNTVPEQYNVVFECQHGKFVLQGYLGSNAHRMWGNLKEGEEVTITYREMFYDSKRAGVNTRTVVYYDFIDAVPRRAR